MQNTASRSNTFSQSIVNTKLSDLNGFCYIILLACVTMNINYRDTYTHTPLPMGVCNIFDNSRKRFFEERSVPCAENLEM